MSLEKIGSAPVTDVGYFDVPICDEYSNTNQPRTVYLADEFQLNDTIQKTINNNKAKYVVKEYPTRPSASLYYETNKASSSYYNPNYINKYYNVEQFSNQEKKSEDTKHKFFFILLLIIILGFILFCCK
jgi:ATP-dependent Zn protease